MNAIISASELASELAGARTRRCCWTSAGSWAARTCAPSTRPGTSPAPSTSTWTPNSPARPGAGGRHPLPDSDVFGAAMRPGGRLGRTVPSSCTTAGWAGPRPAPGGCCAGRATRRCGSWTAGSPPGTGPLTAGDPGARAPAPSPAARRAAAARRGRRRRAGPHRAAAGRAGRRALPGRGGAHRPGRRAHPGRGLGPDHGERGRIRPLPLRRRTGGPLQGPGRDRPTPRSASTAARASPPPTRCWLWRSRASRRPCTWALVGVVRGPAARWPPGPTRSSHG